MRIINAHRHMVRWSSNDIFVKKLCRYSTTERIKKSSKVFLRFNVFEKYWILLKPRRILRNSIRMNSEWPKIFRLQSSHTRNRVDYSGSCFGKSLITIWPYIEIFIVFKSLRWKQRFEGREKLRCANLALHILSGLSLLTWNWHPSY